MERTPTISGVEFIEVIGPDPALSDKELITNLVSYLVDEFGNGTVNGRALARSIFARRGPGANETQTTDYVLYVLRETKQVCRHSVGNGFYKFHKATSCSTECRESWFQTERTKARPVLSCCGFVATTAGLCPGCS